MSIQGLLDVAGGYPLVLFGFFCVLPLLAWGMGRLPVETEGPLVWSDYGFSILIYLAGMPGTISAVLIAYSLFIVRQNLLQVDFLIYFLPLLSMVLTFYVIGRKVDFDRLPGFERLSGLMMLIGVSFLIVLIIFKLRILVGFFASIESFVALGIVLFVVFKVSAKKLFK